MKILRVFVLVLFIVCLAFTFVPEAWAFCGFYVAKADASLYNQASQVAIARNGDRTVLTMANDYRGEIKDFAIVVPVPVVLQENQVQVAEPKIMERLDAFSAPRLVEYFDPDPCAPMLYPAAPSLSMGGASRQALEADRVRSADALGVTIEAQYTVGEYDILMLSARESNGLETWLTQNGYRIPANARQLLRPYIRQNMKFFVAKVNLDTFESSGYQSLRPLQIAYESPRFMLPIRLGMVNADAAQDLIVYILSPEGQAEVTNYRTVKIPSNTEIPVFVKEAFSDFYKSTFETAYAKEGRNIAFLEYSWDMAGCDPCSAEPLTQEEMQQAGVFWLNSSASSDVPTGRFAPPISRPSVFLTRLHVRYTRDRFPEDLMFHATNNHEFFQGRYILRHPFVGEGGTVTCEAGRQYRRSLPRRFEEEAQTLARLTGWNIQEIRRKLPQINGAESLTPWLQQVWSILRGSRE